MHFPPVPQVSPKIYTFKDTTEVRWWSQSVRIKRLPIGWIKLVGPVLVQVSILLLICPIHFKLKTFYSTVLFTFILLLL